MSIDAKIKQKDQYSYIYASDIFNDPEIKDEWIVEEFLLSGDETIIHAPGGIGKSLLTLYMALSLGLPEAESNKLFGKFKIPKRRNTLFIQSENSRKNTKKRLEAIVTNQPQYKESLKHILFMGEKDSIRIIGKPLRDTTFQEAVIDYIKNAPIKIDLLILDPLISFIDCPENDSTEMRSNLNGLTAIAKTTKVTPIVVHHNAKDSKHYRGSTALRDWARSLISMYPKQKSETLIEIENTMANNKAEFKSFILTKPQKGMMFQDNLKSPKDTLSEDDYFKQIIDTLKKYGGEYTGSQASFIKEVISFGGSKATATRRMNAMIDLDIINHDKSNPNSNVFKLILEKDL